MTVLSLFSGIGGLDLGIKIAVPSARVIGYVEQDAYCQRVLMARMSDGSLDAAPIWPDVGTFDGRPWAGAVDLVCGGFPCQPVSVAGKRKGQEDERWLWPEFARVVDEVRPGLVFAENVPGLLVRGLVDVLRDLAALGYDAEWLCLPAAAVGAPHRRERVFLLGYSQQCRLHGHPWGRANTVSANGHPPLADTESVDGERSNGERDRFGFPKATNRNGGCSLGNAAGPRLEGQAGARVQCRLSSRRRCTLADTEGQCGELRSAEGERPWRPAGGSVPVPDPEELLGSAEQWEQSDGAGQRLFPPGPADRDGWSEFLRASPDLEPAVRRGAPGLSGRVDRLRALGNAVVPLQAAAAFTELVRRISR